MLSPKILMADLLDISPVVASLMLELRVDCLGCSMSRFCSLENLCTYYELDLDSMVKRIQEELSD